MNDFLPRISASTWRQAGGPKPKIWHVLAKKPPALRAIEQSAHADANTAPLHDAGFSPFFQEDLSLLGGVEYWKNRDGTVTATLVGQDLGDLEIGGVDGLLCLESRLSNGTMFVSKSTSFPSSNVDSTTAVGSFQRVLDNHLIELERKVNDGNLKAITLESLEDARAWWKHYYTFMSVETRIRFQLVIFVVVGIVALVVILAK